MDSSIIKASQMRSDNSQDDRLFFSLMQKAGSMGNYQIFTYVLWSMIAYIIGGMVFSIPFLFYQNDYQCTQAMTTSQCYDYVCSLLPQQRLEFIVPSQIQSMINKFGDYRCPQKLEEMNWAITGSYSGIFIGMFILLVFGDCFGLKTISLVNLLVASLGTILTVFSNDLWQATIGLFLAKLGFMVSFQISFYFITQTVSQKYRERFSAQTQVFYGVGATSNVLWFYWIGNYQYILLSCYVIPSVIIMGLMLIYVKQTPMVLITKHKTQKILQDFRDIARFNKKEDFNVTSSDIEGIKAKYQKILSSKSQSSKSSNKNFTFLDLFKYKSLRSITIMLTILICSITFIFLAPSLLLSEFHFDIFINGLVIQSSQILAYILACFIVSKIKRKTIAYVCFFITFLSSFLLIFVWDQNSTQITETSSKILILILVFLIQFSVSTEFASFYVYFNEIYPTQVRVLGTGLVAASSGILFTFSQKLIEICYSYNLKVMIVITALTGVCLVCSYLLPQTFGKIPAQLIQELSTKSNQKTQSLLLTSHRRSQRDF